MSASKRCFKHQQASLRPCAQICKLNPLAAEKNINQKIRVGVVCTVGSEVHITVSPSLFLRLKTIFMLLITKFHRDSRFDGYLERVGTSIDELHTLHFVTKVDPPMLIFPITSHNCSSCRCFLGNKSTSCKFLDSSGRHWSCGHFACSPEGLIFELIFLRDPEHLSEASLLTKQPMT